MLCGCPLQRPLWGSGGSLKGTGSEAPRERHCGRKDAPKRQGRRDESPPLGAPPREGRMQTRSHRLHGARQENCTAEDIQRGGRFLRWAQTGSMRRRCLLFQGKYRRFLLMCDKEVIEVQKILPFLSGTCALCRTGRAVIRASPPCQQKNNKSQCPAYGSCSRHSCTHAQRFSLQTHARGCGSVPQSSCACGQCS